MSLLEKISTYSKSKKKPHQSQRPAPILRPLLRQLLDLPQKLRVLLVLDALKLLHNRHFTLRVLSVSSSVIPPCLNAGQANNNKATPIISAALVIQRAGSTSPKPNVVFGQLPFPKLLTKCHLFETLNLITLSYSARWCLLLVA